MVDFCVVVVYDFNNTIGGIVMAQIRVQLSIDEQLLPRMDTFAKSMGLSRSAFVATAVSDYMSARDKAPKYGDLFASMASTFEALMRGEITQDEFQLRIDGFDAAVKRLQ